MKQCIFVLSLLAGVLAGGCKSKSNITSRALKDGKAFIISLERTPCFGTCPVYTVRIHSDGKLIYEGKDFANPKGSFETYVPLDEVQKIRTALKETNFMNLEDTYDNVHISDLPSTITTLTIEGKTVKTVKNRYNPPPLLVRLELMVDNLWRNEFEIKE